MNWIPEPIAIILQFIGACNVLIVAGVVAGLLLHVLFSPDKHL